MLSRFKQNVTRFPRTFVVLCIALVLSGLEEYANNHTALYVLASVCVSLVLAYYVYGWFMGNDRRVSALLTILDTFEGREEECSVPDCEECEIEEEAEEDTRCGDFECASCYPEYNEIITDNEPNPPSLIKDESGQDIAEYAVMLAVMLIIVIGTIRLIGGSAGNVFSQIGSKIGGQ
jgi:Flp pilus assembly pilin Flp